MKRTLITIIFGVVVVGLAASVVIAQRGRNRGWREFDDDRRRWSYEDDRRGVLSARKVMMRKDPDFPTWEVDPQFKDDVFTFVRVRYRSGYGGGYGRRGWGGGGWETDFPDSDMNFSWRLHQLTSLKVDPDPIVLDITDPKLFDYPFIYMIEPGRLEFSESEVDALRRYLENGGFMMVDDFWGEDEYGNFYREIKRVFPHRVVEDVPLSHAIFDCVYDMKEKPQVPAINYGRRWGGRRGITYEPDKYYGPNHDTDPHYRAIRDDAGRIMVFICHNTDLGDGWEREGEDREYFEEFSVKKSYPMGINIVTYAMTH